MPGHRPPDPLPPALDRLRESYVRGLPLETFQERVEYLIANGLEEDREPMPWEAPSKPLDKIGTTRSR
jgi:hypothetical protein